MSRLFFRIHSEVSSKSLLDYRRKLDKVSRQRYEDKLRMISEIDPYTIERSAWTDDVSKWADVSRYDIVDYLVYSNSPYTMEELRSLKSLDAYNQFVSG